MEGEREDQDEVVEVLDGTPRELQQLSDTRWHIACRNVMDRLPAIAQVLEEIASGIPSTETW